MAIEQAFRDPGLLEPQDVEPLVLGKRLAQALGGWKRDRTAY